MNISLPNTASRISHVTKRTIIHSSRTSFDCSTSLLPQFLIQCAEDNERRVAFVDHAEGTVITHGKVVDSIGRIANKLLQTGLVPKEKVAVCSFNHINYTPLSLGIIAAGGLPVFCNPGYTVREMEGLFQTADVSRVVGHSKNCVLVQGLCKKLGLSEPLDIGSILEWSSECSDSIPTLDINCHDTCGLYFSSGTTGFPKAVEISHYNYVNQLLCLDHPDVFSFNSATVNNGFLPNFHLLGNLISHHVIQKGACSVVLDGFQPTIFLGAIEQHRIDCGMLVPPIMLFLAKSPLVDDYDLSSLESITCAAAPLSRQIEEEVKVRLRNDGLNIRQSYGSTEAFLTHCVSRGETKQGSVGKLFPNFSCKVVDLAGKEVGVGEAGEILIKGPSVTKGYYRNPAATKEAFEDGWFKTGDIAYYDEDHDFFIIDRLKEFIKVKGFQVAPAELEAILLEHPDIADAAVIGVPDQMSGETPKAFVVTSQGKTLTAEDVRDFVAENVIAYKVPAIVEFIDAIPKLPSGKIQRKLLREREKTKVKN